MSSTKFHSRAKQVKINPGDHEISQCPHKCNEKYIHYKPARALEGKSVVKLCLNDTVRELIVPNREPTQTPVIWPKSEFQRLKSQAHVITKKDRIDMAQRANIQRQRLQEESDKRKELLKKTQMSQKAKVGSKLSELEEEAAKKSQYLLQRAFELRQEQEDEVKKANSLILASKCLAIRQAQIKERELMEKETEEEEQRLDMMMEQKRQVEIMGELKKKEQMEVKSQRHVKEVMQQIKENEMLRLIEAERKEEESRNINRALIAMQRDEEEKIRKKREDQLKTQMELKKANDDLEHYKIVQKQEQRIADLRVQEFMRKKAEREAAHEAEMEAQRIAKEMETTRLRAMQEKSADQQAMKDELNAKRVQEEVERKWREKEKSEAIKRKQTQDALRLGREKQLEDIRKAQAIEIARDEQEFHRVARLQKELHQKELEKQKKQREANVCHRKELLRQINEKEKERILVTREKFEEGSAVRLEGEMRAINLQNVMKNKVKKLRENGVPEQYVRDIERQLKLPE